VAGWAAVRIDRRRSALALPAAGRLDFGGLAKGDFVDRLVAELRDRRGWPGGCVEAGGDLRVWGRPPDGVAWRIAIEDPDRLDRDLLVLQVAPEPAGAVATSSPNRRRWGDGRHHLIDPGTGRPVERPPRSVSAIAATATEAEIVAKSLVVAAGRRVGLLEAVGAVVVAADGCLSIGTVARPAGDRLREVIADGWSIVWPALERA
jgi:thiamine biosynthesis lipoprotein